LLNIIGRDTVSVGQKYREAWQGRLAMKVIITSNEVPNLQDAGGVLASRFIKLVARARRRPCSRLVTRNRCSAEHVVDPSTRVVPHPLGRTVKVSRDVALSGVLAGPAPLRKLELAG
jgi:hypothetical protein